MVKSRRLLGLPVIDIENGKAVGRVSRLVVDPRARRVMAMVVGTGPWAREEQLLLWNRARGVGSAAVTVNTSQALVRAGALPELQPLLRRPTRIYGARVLTEDGTYLGNVDELILDAATGQVTQVLLAPTGLGARLRPPLALPADCLVVMGEDAVVAREGARPVPLRSARPGPDGQGGLGRPDVPDGSLPRRPPASRGEAREGTDGLEKAAAPEPSGQVRTEGEACAPDGTPGGSGMTGVLARVVVPLRRAARMGLDRVRERAFPRR